MRYIFVLILLVSACRDCHIGSLVYIEVSNEGADERTLEITPAYRELSYYVGATGNARIAHAWKCRTSGGHDSFWLKLKIDSDICFYIHRDCNDKRELQLSCDADSCTSSEGGQVDCEGPHP